MTEYPNSECDKHRDIKTDMPVCIVCMAEENERMLAADRNANEYARTLAIALHEKHYPDVVAWRPLPDTIDLLTQIDNMTSGLVTPNAVGNSAGTALSCQSGGAKRNEN